MINVNPDIACYPQHGSRFDNFNAMQLPICYLQFMNEHS